MTHYTLRAFAEELMQVALRAADPAEAVRRHVTPIPGGVSIAGRAYSLADYRRVQVIAFGKAAEPMSAALLDLLPGAVSGQIVLPAGSVPAAAALPVIEAGHPLPNAGSVAAGQAVFDRLRDAGKEDLVICLISGGGSALLTCPAPGIGLADLQATTHLLLRCGATIGELNAVRKHLDLVKGGGLVRAAGGAHVVSLILSDVVGDPLDVIASGPTVSDPTTFAEAWRVLARYDLLDSVPDAVKAYLLAGQRGERPETLKPGDARLDRVHHVIVGSLRLAAEAVVESAAARGWHTLLLTTTVEGEARQVARVAAAVAKEVVRYDRPVPRPACLVWGGETTVTVRGSGRGGRNQELALAAALALDGWPVGILALATDGVDGPTDAAGAWADGTTVARARAQGLDARQHLIANDAYPFFAALGDLVITGPTGTNVNDLLVVLVA